MFERILVPLDGSDAAEIVFPYVVETAMNFASGIYLTHVTEPASSMENRDYNAYLDGARLKLRSLLESWGVQPDAKIQTRVLGGNTAVEILKYADEINAGLITVASRGASGAGPWPLGAVAAKLLRASSIPVLLIRKPADNVRLMQRKLIRRVLAPLDGSRLGEAAIPLALGISGKTGAEVILFRVFEPFTAFSGPTGEVAWNFMSAYETGARIPVAQYLERLKNAVSGGRAGIITATGVGQPAGEIIDYAQLNNIDLIAMSTHGRSGLGRWVFGSVTEKVLHSGDQPVLVVRPKKD